MKENAVSKCLAALDILAIASILLKITGGISWSWIWVLSPIWIGLIFFVIVIVIAYCKK